MNDLTSALAELLRHTGTALLLASHTLRSTSFDFDLDAFFSLPLYIVAPVSISAAALAAILFALTMPRLLRLTFGPVPLMGEPVPPPPHNSPHNPDSARLASTARIPCLNPATAAPLGSVPAMSAADVYHRVERARDAQRVWARTSYAQRSEFMGSLKVYILMFVDSLVNAVCDDTGKTRVDAMLGEVFTTIEKLDWVAKYGQDILESDVRRSGAMAFHKRAQVRYRPLGVIAAIQPWNYPLHNIFNPVISALFAGNACVVKVSEHASWSSVYFGDVLRECLRVAGYPPDLVQIVTGYAEAGEALVHAADKVFFTGSTAVGKKVAEAAARSLTPVVLELGGKDPFIICADADIDHATTILLRGVFQNAGQNCIGVERVFLERDIEQRVLDRILPVVKALRQGTRDDDVAAMTMGAPAIQKVEELVNDAVAAGATLLCGGKRNMDLPNGFFFEPTVLTGVTPAMRIAREEVFGPVLSVFTFTSDAKLVRMVNDCPFGLGSSVFSGSAARADRITRSLRVGMTNINDFGINYLCQSLPFGGTKDSGSDRFAGAEGLRACCLPVSMTTDRIPFVKTTIPKPLRYPIAPNGFAFLVEMTKFFYETGVAVKVENIVRMIRMLLYPRWVPARRVY